MQRETLKIGLIHRFSRGTGCMPTQVPSDDAETQLPDALRALLQTIDAWNRGWPFLGNFRTRGDYQEPTTLDEILCTKGDSPVKYSGTEEAAVVEFLEVGRCTKDLKKL